MKGIDYGYLNRLQDHQRMMGDRQGLRFKGLGGQCQHIDQLKELGLNAYFEKYCQVVKANVASGKGEIYNNWTNHADQVLPMLYHSEMDDQKIQWLFDHLDEGEKRLTGGIISPQQNVQAKALAEEILSNSDFKALDTPMKILAARKASVPSTLYPFASTELRANKHLSKTLQMLDRGLLLGELEEREDDKPYIDGLLEQIMADAEVFEYANVTEQVYSQVLESMAHYKDRPKGIPKDIGRWVSAFLTHVASAPETSIYQTLVSRRKECRGEIDLLCSAGTGLLTVLAARAHHDKSLMAEHPEDLQLLEQSIKKIEESATDLEYYKNDGVAAFCSGARPTGANHGFYGLSFHQSLAGLVNPAFQEASKQQLHSFSMDGLPWSLEARKLLMVDLNLGLLSHGRLHSAAGSYEIQGHSDQLWKLMAIVQETYSVPMAAEARRESWKNIKHTPSDFVRKNSDLYLPIAERQLNDLEKACRQIEGYLTNKKRFAVGRLMGRSFNNIEPPTQEEIDASLRERYQNAEHYENFCHLISALPDQFDEATIRKVVQYVGGVDDSEVEATLLALQSGRYPGEQEAGNSVPTRPQIVEQPSLI